MDTYKITPTDFVKGPDVKIHPTAIVDEPVNIGTGTKIWHWGHVMGGAEIGEDCVLGQNVYVGATARLGNNVRVQNNVSIYDEVTLEDDVFCGPSMVFTNVILWCPAACCCEHHKPFCSTLTFARAGTWRPATRRSLHIV